MPGAPAQPDTGLLAVVANPAIAMRSIRHEPIPFSLPARRECAVNFSALTPAWLFQYASGTAPGPNGSERYAHLAPRLSRPLSSDVEGTG
jgi:hypothetical protein